MVCPRGHRYTYIPWFQNLLYENESEDADIKIVDFGFAQMKRENEGLTTPCFTLQYAAPEVLKRAANTGGAYDESCDMWSMGVILVRLPYESVSCHNSRLVLLESSASHYESSDFYNFNHLIVIIFITISRAILLERLLVFYFSICFIVNKTFTSRKYHFWDWMGN